jgi:hypothetical protein
MQNIAWTPRCKDLRIGAKSVTQCVTNRWKLVTGFVVCALVFAVFARPAGRAVVLASLVHVAEIGLKILRLPCWIVDHSKCFSLDRFDPTCPPYL